MGRWVRMVDSGYLYGRRRPCRAMHAHLPVVLSTSHRRFSLCSVLNLFLFLRPSLGLFISSVFTTLVALVLYRWWWWSWCCGARQHLARTTHESFSALHSPLCRRRQSSAPPPGSASSSLVVTQAYNAIQYILSTCPQKTHPVGTRHRHPSPRHIHILCTVYNRHDSSIPLITNQSLSVLCSYTHPSIHPPRPSSTHAY